MRLIGPVPPIKLPSSLRSGSIRAAGIFMVSDAGGMPRRTTVPLGTNHERGRTLAHTLTRKSSDVCVGTHRGFNKLMYVFIVSDAEAVITTTSNLPISAFISLLFWETAKATVEVGTKQQHKTPRHPQPSYFVIYDFVRAKRLRFVGLCVRTSESRDISTHGLGKLQRKMA